MDRLRSLSLEPSSSEFCLRPIRRSLSFRNLSLFFGEIDSTSFFDNVLATSLNVGGFATHSRTTILSVGEKFWRTEFRFSENLDSNFGKSNSHPRRNFSRPISTENKTLTFYFTIVTSKRYKHITNFVQFFFLILSNSNFICSSVSHFGFYFQKMNLFSFAIHNIIIKTVILFVESFLIKNNAFNRKIKTIGFLN
jgi:hypothetical protein